MQNLTDYGRKASGYMRIHGVHKTSQQTIRETSADLLVLLTTAKWRILRACVRDEMK